MNKSLGVMDKIDFGLQTEMKSNPQGEFDVIIIVEEGADIESLDLRDGKVLMSTILAATLTVEDIYKLAKNKDVVFIENDHQVGIL